MQTAITHEQCFPVTINLALSIISLVRLDLIMNLFQTKDVIHNLEVLQRSHLMINYKIVPQIKFYDCELQI